MNKETILGVLRHILTFGGGFLVTKGVADAGMVETGIGALTTIIGLVWSIVEKRNRPA